MAVARELAKGPRSQVPDSSSQDEALRGREHFNPEDPLQQPNSRPRGSFGEGLRLRSALGKERLWAWLSMG